MRVIVVSLTIAAEQTLCCRARRCIESPIWARRPTPTRPLHRRGPGWTRLISFAAISFCSLAAGYHGGDEIFTMCEARKGNTSDMQKYQYHRNVGCGLMNLLAEQFLILLSVCPLTPDVTHRSALEKACIQRF